MPANAGQQVCGYRAEPERVADFRRRKRPGHCPVRPVQGGEPRSFAWVALPGIHFTLFEFHATISRPCEGARRGQDNNANNEKRRIPHTH